MRKTLAPAGSAAAAGVASIAGAQHESATWFPPLAGGAGESFTTEDADGVRDVTGTTEHDLAPQQSSAEETGVAGGIFDMGELETLKWV